MTIQSAIKSKKPFKRPGYSKWIVINPYYVDVSLKGGSIIEGPIPAPFIYEGTNSPAHFAPAAILADDWIIKNG